MRHGQAEPVATSDAARQLTEKGRWQAKQTAIKLQAHGVVPDRIISSPYIRAMQTATTSAAIWNIAAIEKNSAFTPDDDPRVAIEKLPETGTVLLVSHMPLVSYMTGLLTDADPYAGLRFSTASAAVIDMNYPAAGLGTFVRMVDAV